MMPPWSPASTTLQASNGGGEDAAALPTFNIAYDTGVVPWEGHHVNQLVRVLPRSALPSRGCGRSSFNVDGEKKSLKDKCQSVHANVMVKEKSPGPNPFSLLMERMIWPR